MQHRQVVEDPERATLGCDDKLLFTFMNGEVGDRHDGQVKLQRLPTVAVVERDVQPRFRTGIKQSTLVWILTNHARERRVGNSVRDLLPGLSVIAGAIEIGPIVVPLVHRPRNVGGAGIVRRGFERVDLDPLRHHARRRRDIRPVLAAIARQMDQSIITAGPDRPRLNRRFHQREDRRVVLDARVVFGYRTARRTLFCLVVTR